MARPDRRNAETDIERELIKSALERGLFGEAKAPVRRGRFELLNLRGRGGMGVVYEAFDTERAERVALKCLTWFEADAIARLKREFRSLAALDHPNLVRLDGLFHQGGQWFFSMELVDGVPFDRFVRQSAEPEVALRAALHQVADAVNAIHAAGKLHRDLKPSNVLVTRDARVVVLDFGLVCDLPIPSERLRSHKSDLVGTPAFVAPEILEGRDATRESDFYAVGVMLFQALTGRLPFEGDVMSILRDKQARGAPDPRTIATEAPDDLSELCLRLLARNPEERCGLAELTTALGRTPDARHSEARSRPAPFVGRAAELEALQAAQLRATLGEVVVLCIHGGSGMGKSALLDRYCESLREKRDTLVLRGRCHEQESVPYKVLDGVVDALSHYLAKLPSEEARALLPRHLSALLQLFPTLAAVPAVAAASTGYAGPPGAREKRNHAFAALKELLLRLTDRMQVVLAIDDLQWGDIDSARMLATVLDPPDAPPLLLLGAYRSDELETSEFLRAFFERTARAVPCEQLALNALPLAEADELAHRLLGALADDEACHAIAAESAGVPLFIAELARHAEAHHDGTHEAKGSLSLERLIREHVASLPQSAQRLLQVLAVAAGPLELRVATDAAALGEERRAAMQALRSARLARLRNAESDTLVEIYHDRIRETIALGLSAEDLRRFHRAIREALERGGLAEPERLMPHYAGEGERVRAGEAALQAGVIASQKLAFNQAARFFKLALEFLPSSPERSCELHTRLGDALANAGRGIAAGEAYLEAAKTAPADQSRELRALAAVQYLGTTRAAEGLELAREVLATVGVPFPTHPLMVLSRVILQQLGLRQRRRAAPASPLSAVRAARLKYLRLLLPAVSWADGLRGFMLHRFHLKEAIASGDQEHLLAALTSEAGFVAMAGGPRNERQAIRLVAEIRELAAELGTRQAQVSVAIAEGTRLLWTGRYFQDALEFARRAEELLTQETGSYTRERLSIGVIRLVALEFRAELNEVAALSREHERDARERGDQFIPLTLLSCTPIVHLAEDRPEAALELLETIGERARVSANLHHVWILRMTDVLHYLGRARDAFDLWNRQWSTLRRSYLYQGEFGRDLLRYYRARCALILYLEQGDPETRSYAQRMIAKTSADSGYGLTLRAALYAQEGDRKRASATLQASTDWFRARQGGNACLHTERCIHQLGRDAAGIAAIDDKLRKAGVADPERWTWTYIPMPRDL